MHILLIMLLMLVLANAQPVTALAQPPAYSSPEEYVQGCVPEWAGQADLLEALKDAGTNWTELAQALDSCTINGAQLKQQDDFQHAYENMAWLIKTAPHLDRLELTAMMLQDNMRLALEAAAQRQIDPNGDYFKRYLLNYRFDDEPVTDWRGELAKRYTAKLDAAIEPVDAGSIARLAIAVTAGFKVLERGHFGNLADPVSLDNARAGTERELTLLTAAVLRAMGWGVRYVRDGRTGKTWVEAYTGAGDAYEPSAWIPVYPLAPEQTGYYQYARELCGGSISALTAGDAFAVEQVTPRYADVCALTLRFLRGGIEDKEYKHWSIEAWYDGRFVPLDNIAAADDPENPVVGLQGGAPAGGAYYVGAPGQYLLVAGVRYPGGYVHVVTRVVDAVPGATAPVELHLDPPADMPLAAMAERTVGQGAPASGTYIYVVIDEKEPSDHTLRLLEPLRDTPGVEFQVLEAHASDDTAAKLLDEVLMIKADDPKPVVIVLRDGKTLLYQRGYNLNIFDWVKRVLAGS